MTRRLVLASGSPRRREMLERLGLDATVRPAEVDESPLAGEEPEAYVRRLASAKARARAVPGTVTIGADTTVVLDGQIVGKPGDRAEARAMLGALSGRCHEVLTAVAVIADGTREAAAVERSTVALAPVDEARVGWYTSLEEPYDKAGGYALQGAGSLFADRVEGSISNVIGLPLPLLDRLFSQLGIDLLDFRRRP